jgi:tRNA wybutosine-synthesizing protein 4
VFIDVDFPDLMERKRRTVLDTPELRGAFEGLEAVEGNSAVLLRSDRYYQVGCDLRRVQMLREAIGSIVNIEECSFFFVAEVSITYMETPGADGVIEWASSMGDGRFSYFPLFKTFQFSDFDTAQFCLLEQILPDGPDHPFAKTMLSHFDKLNTTLKSVHKYSTLPDQTKRFMTRGWKSVRAWNLWQAWADEEFLTSSDRQKLDEIEPFDEWEEFALFAGHYCLIHARTSSSGSSSTSNFSSTSRSKSLGSLGPRGFRWHEDTRPHSKNERRFGASMVLNSVMGHRVVANVMGLLAVQPRNRVVDKNLGPPHCTLQTISGKIG